MTQLSFRKTKSDFFEEVKEKVDHYFASKKIKKYGNYTIYIKSALFVLAAALSYGVILFFSPPAWCAILLCAFLGVAFAGIGFNMMHDGAHGSYSSKKWLNELMGYSLNAMGGNVFIWKHKHNFNHHTYTNIDGMDDDIDIEPWIRTHVNQPKHWYHKYQHIYGLGLYGITYLYWIFLGDFKKYFSKKIGKIDLHEMNLKEHLIFWMSKIIYVGIFLVIPIIKIGFWKTILGFFIMAFICGLILGIVFQLAHLMEDTAFPLPPEESTQMEQNWVLHQISTTVNFAPKSKLTFWFTGGLNFQIVHHIFPKISHVHYPAINQLVKESCEHFNIKYTEYATIWSALCSHLSYLKRMGRC